METFIVNVEANIISSINLLRYKLVIILNFNKNHNKIKIEMLKLYKEIQCIFIKMDIYNCSLVDSSFMAGLFVQIMIIFSIL